MAEPHHPLLGEIWRYPVKGFMGEKLDQLSVQKDCLLPHDREFALTTGHPLSHEKLSEGWLPKRHFIQLLNTASAARYRFEFDSKREMIQLWQDNTLCAHAPAGDPKALSDALYQRLPDAFMDRPILSQLQQGGYSDTAAPWITLAGRASIQAFAELTGTLPDVRRFRLNLILETDIPFIERSWAGQILRMGDTELEVIEPVGRCGAISVNPETCQKEADYLPAMERAWGHTDLGMFARITQSGQLVSGQNFQLQP